MNNNMTAVVIGFNYSTTLSIVKSLGRAGYNCEVGRRVVALRKTVPIEAYSKYVSKCEYLVMDEEPKMISFIISTFSDKNNLKLLLPADDFCAALIDTHYNSLSKYFLLPNKDNKEGELYKLMDKKVQKRVASQSGLLTANTIELFLGKDNEYDFPEGVHYPCFIKPLKSASTFKTVMSKANNDEELKSLLDNMPNKYRCDLLIEKYIEVTNEYTIPVLALKNEVIIPCLLKKKFISKGGHRGVTITGIVKSATEYESLVTLLKNFVKNLNLTGLFDIEILEDNGKFYFNELNLRNGAAAYALTASGTNLPQIYADSLFNIKTTIKETFKPGGVFVSDKAAVEYYREGFGSILQCFKLLIHKDIHLLLDEECLKFKFYFIILIAENFLARYAIKAVKFYNKYKKNENY